MEHRTFKKDIQKIAEASCLGYKCECQAGCLTYFQKVEDTFE